jgi:nitrate/nitrite transporter NarK
MFLVNIPFGIAAFTVICLLVPTMRARPAIHRFDWPGTALACTMLTALALGLTWGQRDGFGSPLIEALLAVAVLGFGAFVLVESLVAGPSLDLRVFRNRPFAIGLSMSGLVFVVLGGTGFLLPFYLEIVAGYPTAKVGLLMAVSPVLGGLTAPMGGTLADRLGARRVSLAGLTLLAVGCALLASVGPQISALEFALRVAPIGMGMGLFNAANNSSVLNAVPRERLGIASALLSLMRTLGQTTGVPLLATVFSLAALGHGVGEPRPALLTLPAPSLVHGMHWAFATAACIALLALTAGAWDFVRRRGQSSRRRADQEA